jgi:hypothetical protein
MAIGQKVYENTDNTQAAPADDSTATGDVDATPKE